MSESTYLQILLFLTLLTPDLSISGAFFIPSLIIIFSTSLFASFLMTLRLFLSTVLSPRPVCFRYFLLLFRMPPPDCNGTIVSAVFLGLPPPCFFLFEYFLYILMFVGKELLLTMLYLA